MRSPRRRGGGAIVLAALSLGATVAVACSDSGSSSGGTTTSPGDTVTNDTRDAEPRPPANPDPGDGSLTGEPDGYASGQPVEDGGYGGGYGDDAPAAYPGVAECSSCACPSATAYCFGGATPRHLPMSVTIQGGADAGPPCPMVAAGVLGCTALPAGLTDCVSLLNALQPSYSCYLDCAFDGKTMTVYCPSP